MFTKMYIAIKNSAMLSDFTGEYAWVNTLTKVMNDIIAPILGVVAGLGALWAIWIAVQMARADDAGKREEAKKRLIWVIIAVVVLVALMAFFLWLFPMIMKNFGIVKDPE